MRISPRFAVMFLAMILSIIFTVIDICAVTGTLKSVLPIGINPFWKLAFVFKLLTDSVILDDFKTALDKLSHYNLSRIDERLGDNWASTKNMAIHIERRREPSMQPISTAATGGRPRSSARVEPWITVMTETKVESVSMKEMGSLASLKLPRR
jgi:hypothetical protein